MLADHHNRYDFSEWNILITVVGVLCVVLGVLIKRLQKREDETT